jgi:hypothetical protein
MLMDRSQTVEENYRTKTLANNDRLLLLIVVIGVVMAGVAFWWHSDNVFYDAFKTTEKGDDRQSVIDKLGSGKPLECDSLAWGSDESLQANDGSCVSSLRYFRFMTMYLVGFDSEGRVVSRYEGFSP